MRRVRGWAVALCAGLCAVSAASGAVPDAVRVSMREGLPSDRVYQIAEDRQGYRWFATSDGLARHDGRRFRLWRMEQGLPDNDVTSVALDTRNRLWVGTGSGHLLRLSADRQQVLRLDEGRSQPVAAGAVTTLLPLADGTVWFGTRDAGLYRRAADGRIDRFVPGEGPARLPSLRVRALALGPDDTVWIGTAGGLARWRNGAFLPTATPGQAIHALAPAGRHMWVGAVDGVRLYTAAGTPAMHGQSPGLRLLGVGRDGARWLARDDRVWREDPHTGAQRAVSLTVPVGRARPRVVRLHEDRDGGVWLLGAHLGAWRLRPDWKAFHAVHGNLPAQADAALPAFAASRAGGAWQAGPGAGLYWIDGATAQRTRRLRMSGAAPGQRRAVVEDARGQVWIAAADGLTRWDPRSGARRHWPASAPGALDAGRLLRSCGPHLWLLEGETLEQRDLHGAVRGRWVRGGAGVRATPAAAAVQCTADGTLWMGDAAGLHRWHPQRPHRAPAPVPVPMRTEGAVTALHVDAQDRLWVAARSAVIAYRWQGGQLVEVARRTLGPEDGPVRSLTGDADGALWAGTARGVLQLAPGRQATRLLTPADGLPVAALGGGPLLRAGPRVLLPLLQGGDAVLLDAAALGAARPDPPPVLDRVQVRRHGVLVELPPASPLRLQPGDRDLRVQVRVLSSDGRRREYRMRMAGQQAGWIGIGRPGIREFPRLAPGHHRVLYQARRAQGPWSDAQVVEVHMAPTVLERTDVRVALALCGGVLGLVVAGLWRRLRRQRRARGEAALRQAADERAGQAKADYLATLGHEIRTPLTGVLGMSELLLDAGLAPAPRAQVQRIHRAGHQLLRIVDDTLDTARIDAGRLLLHTRRFAPLPVLQRVLATEVLPLCQRGQSLAGCLALAPTLTGRGDPVRMAQCVQHALRALAEQTGARQLLLHAAPLPGRSGVLVALAAHMRGGRRAAGRAVLPTPTPSRDGLLLALGPARLRAEGMAGRLAVVAAPDGWRVMLSLPMEGGLQEGSGVDPVEDPTACALPPVLLAMQDTATARRLADGLRAQGRTVVHAVHALAALPVLSAAPLAALLVEGSLPGIDGLALIGLARDRGWSAPAWLLDPAPTSARVAQARMAGALGVLPLALSAAAIEALLQAGPEATR
ncbi:two-component regulator propeller domain-containing protein [Stenotrophomonas sp. LGBM10]|uniref:two-component regulator propeller domain-containing protein n=1 Tax=Stenotrophomonas sp. LGBM10 TaxID=3390038 RepID=UPI00398B6041